MNEKTIKGMTKPELVNLIEETIDKITKIDEVKKDLDQDDLPNKVRAAHEQVAREAGEIQNMHQKIFEGDDSNDSIEERIDDFLKNLKSSSREMFGFSSEDKDGNPVENKGYIASMKSKLEESADKNKKLQGEVANLLSSATTGALSQAFDDKVKQYKNARRMWQTVLVIMFLLPFIDFYFAFEYELALGWEEIGAYFLVRLPIIAIFAWAVIFVGNCRAENLKLEESYTHKAVMAQSYVGYKESIKKLSDDDAALMKELMANLLDALEKDSSEFLSAKGEGPPASEVIKELLQKVGNN